jgi:hypothetical protein
VPSGPESGPSDESSDGEFESRVDEFDVELREELGHRLATNAAFWREFGPDVCVEGQASAAAGAIRFIEVSPGTVTVSFVELRRTSTADRDPRHVVFTYVGRASHVPLRSVSTRTLAKVVAVSDPSVARRISHERFVGYKRRKGPKTA